MARKLTVAQYEEKLLRAQAGMHGFLEDFLLGRGLEAMARAKRLTPVDTGNLRNRWELSAVERVEDGLQITIRNPTEYARHVEEGHKQVAGNLPLDLLQSPRGREMASSLRAKYGKGTQFIRLKEKQIPGVFMLKLSMQEVRRGMNASYKKAFRKYWKTV